MTRLAIALGIMDDRVQTNGNGERLKHYILPPPISDLEREERRVLACELVRIQAEYSATGTWTNTLPLEEIVRLQLGISS